MTKTKSKSSASKNWKKNNVNEIGLNPFKVCSKHASSEQTRSNLMVIYSHHVRLYPQDIK